MRELTDVKAVASASGDDALACWTAQSLAHGGSAYASGDAVAVVAPALFRRDRLVVTGEPDDAGTLVSALLPALPRSYHVVGDLALIQTVADTVPGLIPPVSFGWMDTPTPAPAADGRAGWLDPSGLEEAAELVRRVHPGSWAYPGMAADHRWAGVRADDGTLAAVAADAWSGGGIGFITGVVTDDRHRRRRFAHAVTGFVANELLHQHNRVALMVDADNHGAVRLYRGLGFTMRPIAATRRSGD